MSSNTTQSSSIGISTIVFLIFLVLKLAGIGAVANWSWWWVCSPLWISASAGILFLIIFLLLKLLFKD